MICSLTKTSKNAFKVIYLLTLALAVVFGGDKLSFQHASAWEAHAEENTDSQSDNTSNDSSDSSDNSADTSDDADKDKDEDTEKDNKTEEHAEKKQKETDTPPPEEEEKTYEEQLDEKLDKIKNPETNQDLAQYFPPGFKRKFDQAEAAAATKGKTIDLVSRKNIDTTKLNQAYDQLEATIRNQILANPSFEQEGLETLALAQTGMRVYNGGGAARDLYGTAGPGRPGLAQSQGYSVQTLNNINRLLSDPKALTVDTGRISRLNIAKQEAFQWADYTSITQGNWGSCWTCSANAYLWAERPDVASDAINQVLFDNQYRAGNGTLFVPGGANWPSGNAPSQSNLAYDFSEGGEQSYAGRIMQQVIGVVADDGINWTYGPTPPWEGGVPEYASNAVGKMTGDTNYRVPNLRQIGGIPGLEAGINDGRYRVVQYIPFPGHSASQSGYLLPTTDGEFLGFGVNDNSWGTRNENMFLATPENRNRWTFPGGGGSRFGGPGFSSAMNGIINGLQNLGNQQNAASQQNANAARLKQMNEREAKETYSKLTKDEKVVVRNVCIQTTRPGTGLPSLCKAAVTDASLPKMTAHDLMPSNKQRDSMVSSF